MLNCNIVFRRTALTLIKFMLMSFAAIYPGLMPAANDDTLSDVVRRTQILPAAAGGNWSTPEPWPVLAVHANLLPNGKVLSWDATPDDFDEDPHTTENYTTRVTVWDPQSNQHQSANNNTDTDLFCAGSAHLWDGRVLFAGGDSEPDGRNGPLSNTNIYDPWTNTWERADNMFAARWYSSVAALPNGELLTLGGSYSPQPLAEVFQLNHRWRSLNLQPPYSLSGDYQWIQSGPDGSVLYFGPHDNLSTVHTEGHGHWEFNSVRDGHGYRGYGSYAMYDVGKILVSGGGDSSSSSIVIDATDKQTSSTGSMVYGRRQHNLTILADGSVLATGGNHSGSELVDLYTGVLTPEIWNPATGTWYTVNDMHVDRQYHSIALLLPDARVLSAGGGYCGLCAQLAYHEQNGEIYSPPYLFDENSQLARRPVINSAPDELNYASTFFVSLDSTNAVSKAHLIKLGSVTHSENQEQRLIPLSVTQNGAQLTLTAPKDRNEAPPGHYMLFVVENGVPSIAHIIKVGQPLLDSDNLVRNTISSGQQHVYAFEATDDQHLLVSALDALNNDLDLAIRRSTPPDQSLPDSSHACTSRNTGTKNEQCQIEITQGETIYIAVQSDQLSDQSSHYSLSVSAALSSSETGNSVIFDDGRVSLESLHTLIRDQLIPTAPNNLRGVIYSQSTLELFWDASIDNSAVQGYELFRNNELIQQIDARSNFQTDLVAGQSYAYTVRAYDDEGNRSSQSNRVVLHMPGTAPDNKSVATAPQDPEEPATTATTATQGVDNNPPQTSAEQPASETESVSIADDVDNSLVADPATSEFIEFALIDASADVIIPAHRNINSGDVIRLSSLPSTQLNIEARVSGIADISKVRFDFNGVEGFRNELIYPYALFGDRRTDYIGMPLASDQHTVLARVFVGDAEVYSQSISFSVLD